MFRTIAPAAAALLALALAPAASARLAVTASTPAANSTASRVTSVTMAFNEPVAPATVRAQLIMTAMPGMTDHPPMKMQATSAIGRNAKSLTMTLKRPLVAGTYKVTWTAAAKTGQTVNGEYSFTVR